ncbi:MAG TPA: transglutaminase-like domain-containing protein [Gemmatimonadaceae bacterium]|nr:transglutaminase-like domain-containing protein [Gemmatimonadaceae bacterium]
MTTRRLGRRGTVAAGVLLLWGAGLGVLARRELTARGSDGARLAAVASRVSPGNAFYAVEQGGTQIGYASSTIDTTTTEIRVDDDFVADMPVGGTLHRASASSRVRLTRGFALRTFAVEIESDAGPIRVTGRTQGDSLLLVAVSTNGEPADTQRVVTNGPVLLPTLLPLAVALGERPRVGARYTLSVFDPTAMAPRPTTIAVRAESLFVVDDSAAVDRATRRWHPAHRDTVRAWRIESETADAGGSAAAGARPGFAGWVDADGRLVELAPPGGLVLRRTAYEIAFENWRVAALQRAGRTVTADEDIMESTAIAASAPLGEKEVEQLRVRLGGVDLAGYDLNGSRQVLLGNTLMVIRERPDQLRAMYTLPTDESMRATFARELESEPLLQASNPKIVELAHRLAAGARDPRVVAERINQWMYDSLAKEITFGLPNAVQVLESRKGDCNEHTQLYIALARAAGIPARPAAGLAYVRGKFYYHAWPEVFLGTWVAVDPTFGEFPADAAHLRFVNGGLDRQAELLRLIGKLKIEVLAKR